MAREHPRFPKSLESFSAHFAKLGLALDSFSSFPLLVNLVLRKPSLSSISLAIFKNFKCIWLVLLGFKTYLAGLKSNAKKN